MNERHTRLTRLGQYVRSDPRLERRPLGESDSGSHLVLPYIPKEPASWRVLRLLHQVVAAAGFSQVHILHAVTLVLAPGSLHVAKATESVEYW
jgi:hypothetical protein